jgi:hypothetical protein
VTSEAKAFGINRHATPRVWEARNLCPYLKIFTKPDYYGKQDSRKTRHATWALLDCVKEYCGGHINAGEIVVELGSSDEIYLDLSVEISRRVELMMKRHLEAWPYSAFFPVEFSQNVVFEARYEKVLGPFSSYIPVTNVKFIFNWHN